LPGVTTPLALGIALAASLLAWAAQALSADGAVAAWLVGAMVLALLGWTGGSVLLAFFLPSTLIGRWGIGAGGASDARGERRDAVQVLANGGAAALGACAELLAKGLGFWILSGALATAAADTWATSLGSRSAHDPKDLLRRTSVPRGTSGAVSWLGSWGAVAGAFVVAATAALVRHSSRGGIAVLLIGIAGMLLDSLLGATVQGRFRCPACAVSSERRRHRCGARTERVSGWRWLDNDGVNAAATTVGALAAGLCWSLGH